MARTEPARIIPTSLSEVNRIDAETREARDPMIESAGLSPDK